jgi:DNA-directed RNA polymerase specialized sigma24 family protein
MLSTRDRVVLSLLTYTDWYQPSTTSVLHVGAARRSGGFSDGFRDGLLDTLDERTELRRRTSLLDERERQILFLWYVRQLPVNEIARIAGVSRRHCFRLRGRAVQRIVDLGLDAPAA